VKNSQAFDLESGSGGAQQSILLESGPSEGDSLQNGIVILFARD
jgi:hypothetical protein